MTINHVLMPSSAANRVLVKRLMRLLPGRIRRTGRPLMVPSGSVFGPVAPQFVSTGTMVVFADTLPLAKVLRLLLPVAPESRDDELAENPTIMSLVEAWKAEQTLEAIERLMVGVRLAA